LVLFENIEIDSVAAPTRPARVSGHSRDLPVSLPHWEVDAVQHDTFNNPAHTTGASTSTTMQNSPPTRY
jgi:hypothetical protein